MKRKNILRTISSTLLVVWGGPAGIFSLCVGWLINLFMKRNEPKDGPDYEKRESATIEQVTHTYGEPDDLIIVDATRANETEGAILVYETQQFFVICGEKIHFCDIADVTFHNAQLPYAQPEYVVVVTTRLRQPESISISAGQDITWAGDIVAQIKERLNP